MSFLPKNSASFTVDLLGNKTGHRYQGTFEVKCIMSNQEILDAAAAIDRAGGYSPTMPGGFKSFIQAIEELAYSVIDSPKWWRDSMGGRTLEDQNVVTEIYTKAVDVQLDFKKKLQGEAEKAEKNAETKNEKSQTA